MSTLKFSYYALPGKRETIALESEKKAIEEALKDKGESLIVFNRIQKLQSFHSAVFESVDIFMYSRILKLLGEWIGYGEYPSDIVYFHQIFLLIPVFIDHFLASNDLVVHGSFVEGLAAAKQVSSGKDMEIVIVSEDQLHSLAGLHAFFVLNMRNAYTARDEKTRMELLSTYQRIFGAEFTTNIKKVVETIEKTSTKAFSIGFQLAKIMRACDVATPESVARCAQRYEELLDGVYRPTLLLKI